MSPAKRSTVSLLPMTDCQRVLQAGMNPDDRAVEPLGQLSHSKTITSAPVSFAARAAINPAAPAPTIATATLCSQSKVWTN